MKFKYEGGIQRSCGIIQKIYSGRRNREATAAAEEGGKNDVFVAKQKGGPYLKIQQTRSG